MTMVAIIASAATSMVIRLMTRVWRALNCSWAMWHSLR